jgi:predicted transcriptional regulator
MTSASALISVRVSSKTADRLERLAKSVDRSKSYLAAEAIEEYLDIHEWQVQAIQEGLIELEKGELIDFEDIKEQWGDN